MITSTSQNTGQSGNWARNLSCVVCVELLDDNLTHTLSGKCRSLSCPIRLSVKNIGIEYIHKVIITQAPELFIPTNRLLLLIPMFSNHLCVTSTLVHFVRGMYWWWPWVSHVSQVILVNVIVIYHFFNQSWPGRPHSQSAVL